MLSYCNDEYFFVSGTGKTLVARALVHELSKGAQVTFYSRSGSDILSKWFGETEANLRDLFEAVRQESAHEQARTT